MKTKKSEVTNKKSAEIQIMAEQLLQEATATKMEKAPPLPRQKVTDFTELDGRVCQGKICVL